jgi:hypothetical protein
VSGQIGYEEDVAMGRFRRQARGRALACLAVALTFSMTGPSCRAQSPKSDDAQALAVQALADRIDAWLAAAQAKAGVKPTKPAGDAEFLRRASLDIGGRIPRLNTEMHRWLDATSPAKRGELIKKLLDSPMYVEHSTNIWRHMLLPPGNNQQAEFLANSIRPWLREQFRDNVPYDAMVRELLTTPLARNMQQGLIQPQQQNMSAKPTPQAFYQINEFKPENIAASASRLFLGVNLDCAQCHDHKFAPWKKKQFWQFAAFFSGVQPNGENAKKRMIAIGGTDLEVEARYLDGKVPKWQDEASTRQTLAEWLTAADNPYFARNAVNRLWANFFGIGLIDPVDEPNPDNPPSHPELLDELARAFVEHKFDVKFMIRAITATRAYQLSSVATEPGQEDPRLFARMTVKGLSGEQLYDSLAEATRMVDQPTAMQQNQFINVSARQEFLNKFDASNTKRTQHQTSILQALSLMNGKVITDATSLDKGQLHIVIHAESWSTRSTSEKLELLYMSAVARKPRKDELDRLVPYIDKGGPSGDSKKALADVFWALLNSSEFIFNH